MRNHREVLAHWNKSDVESMYDKYLLNAEIELIRQRIAPNTKVLDAGCGEGEGTFVYSTIPGVEIHAVDFSDTRLLKARSRLLGRENVLLKKVDFLSNYNIDYDYDVVVSQRFLINLYEWDIQAKVLLDLMARLKESGKLLMLEGSQQGTNELNEFRAAWGMKPIQVKWHNLFFDDDLLIDFMSKHGYPLVEKQGLGTYFALTRGIRPVLDKNLDWDSDFNRIAASKALDELFGFGTRFSRLKLWVFRKG